MNTKKRIKHRRRGLSKVIKGQKKTSLPAGLSEGGDCLLSRFPKSTITIGVIRVDLV